MIFQLLRRLSPVERQLFECYFVDELSPADCARRLNLEPGELMRQLEHIRTQAQHLRALPPAHP
jgi:DNA-directed RNA polymerase specialized sigma24 family protein